MKQVPLLISLLLICISFVAYAHKEQVFGRSYMFLRPADAHLLTHNFIWLEPNYTKEGTVKGAASATIFFHRTIKQAKNARYFLINGKTELLVTGDDDSRAYMRDVRAEWLNLPSNFAGTLTLQPTQKQSGLILEYNQNVNRFVACGLFEHMQFGIRMPIIGVEQNLHLAQQDVINGGPTSLLDAFNQESWFYAKMPTKKQHKNGVGDITLYIDSAFMAEDHTIIAYHTGVVIPAAPAADPEFLFSPQLGNGHRLAVNGGVDFQLLLNRCPYPMAACFFMSLDATWLLRTHRHRTFDLKKVERQDEAQPWSRFLLFNNPTNPALRNIPGVNVLTRRAHIRPQGMAEFAVGWRFIYEALGWEFGYSVWGHDSERIKEIEDCDDTIFGIAAPGGFFDAPQTASTSTISTLGPTDTTFVAITNGDINLESGAAGSAINHTFYVAANGHYSGSCFDGYFGLDGFVEWPQKNAALMFWGIDLKFSAAF